MTLANKLAESSAFLNSEWHGLKPDLAIVLGSGFKAFADTVEVISSTELAAIPHCQGPRVEGHGSSLLLAQHGKRIIAIMTGRLHMYEGYSASEVCFPLRCLAKTGVRSLILTNAAGGLSPELEPGDVLVLQDQINLTGQTCLDASSEGLGPRFVDMINCYDLDWRTRLKKLNPATKDGIYLGVLGAPYETPAETAFFGRTGANAVGMSTVQETIAARQMGLKVLGLSFVTNLAGGLSQEVKHEDVIRIGKEKAPALHQVILDAIRSAPP